ASRAQEDDGRGEFDPIYSRVYGPLVGVFAGASLRKNCRPMSRWENFKNEWLLGSSVFSTSRDARNDGLFSPDRLRLLSGGDEANPEVRIWDVETGSVFASSKDTNNLSPRSPGPRINDWSPQVPLAAR